MTTDDLELCTDGFHSDECPGCGLTADERDDPANATNAAMNFGEGVASERKRIAEAVRGLAFGLDGVMLDTSQVLAEINRELA
ncbi:MAG TPA: hypothetical protein VII01_03960 [Solirubrobacteraceae bacterium]